MIEGYISTHTVNDSVGGFLLRVPLMIHKKPSEFNQSSLIIGIFKKKSEKESN